MRPTLLAALSASAIAMSSAAHALFVDFTAADTGDFPTTIPSYMTSVGGVTFTLTSPTGGLNANDEVTDPSRPFCTGAHAGAPDFSCASDGFGVGTGPVDGDEVGPNESLVLDISEAVKITHIYVLDLFAQDELPDTPEESARIDFGGNGTVDEEFGAIEVLLLDPNGFEAFAVTSPANMTNRIIFTAGIANDGAGVPDYALAGISFDLIPEERIPLPAALPLLLSGIAGLALFRRRRAA